MIPTYLNFLNVWIDRVFNELAHQYSKSIFFLSVYGHRIARYSFCNCEQKHSQVLISLHWNFSDPRLQQAVNPAKSGGAKMKRTVAFSRKCTISRTEKISPNECSLSMRFPRTNLCFLVCTYWFFCMCPPITRRFWSSSCPRKKLILTVLRRYDC